MSGVNSADSLPAGVAAVGGTQHRDWPVRIRSHGSRAGEMQNREYARRCLAGRCFGREFDSRRLHQPAGARPLPGASSAYLNALRIVTEPWGSARRAPCIFEVVADTDWTSEGPIRKRPTKKRKRNRRKETPTEASTAGRMIVDRWTQAILPPGSDENPNVPGI